MNDAEKILQLRKDGYHVEIINPYGKTFYDKYKVYDNFGWGKLKVVNPRKVLNPA